MLVVNFHTIPLLANSFSFFDVWYRHYCAKLILDFDRLTNLKDVIRHVINHLLSDKRRQILRSKLGEVVKDARTRRIGW